VDFSTIELGMANLEKAMVRLAISTARPNWTLIALACLPASAIAISLRYAFG
jgi:hypothetical protein